MARLHHRGGGAAARAHRRLSAAQPPCPVERALPARWLVQARRRAQGATLAAHGQAPFGRFAVNLAFGVEQRVDALDHLECGRRDRRHALATPLAGRDVGEFMELPPPVAPAERLDHRPRHPPRRIQRIESGTSVGLKESGAPLACPEPALGASIPIIESPLALIANYLHRPPLIPRVAGVSKMLAERAPAASGSAPGPSPHHVREARQT